MHPFSSSTKNVGTKCRYLKVQNLIRFTCQHDIKAVGTFLPFLMMTRPFSRFYLIKKNLLSATIGHLNHGTCLMPDGAQHQFHRAINASMNTILAKSTYILTRVEILCTFAIKLGSILFLLLNFMKKTIIFPASQICFSDYCNQEILIK